MSSSAAPIYLTSQCTNDIKETAARISSDGSYDLSLIVVDAPQKKVYTELPGTGQQDQTFTLTVGDAVHCRFSIVNDLTQKSANGDLSGRLDCSLNADTIFDEYARTKNYTIQNSATNKGNGIYTSEAVSFDNTKAYELSVTFSDSKHCRPENPAVAEKLEASTGN
jgi:hypothetical protein